jgi:hypothetical protein
VRACGAAGATTAHVQAGGIAAEHAGEVELLHLLLEPRRQSGVHRRAAGEDDVLVELGADVDGGGLDRLEEHLCKAVVSRHGGRGRTRSWLTGNAGLLNIHEMRLEHAFGCFESLGANLDDTAVG